MSASMKVETIEVIYIPNFFTYYSSLMMLLLIRIDTSVVADFKLPGKLFQVLG